MKPILDLRCCGRVEVVVEIGRHVTFEYVHVTSENLVTLLMEYYHFGSALSASSLLLGGKVVAVNRLVPKLPNNPEFLP